MTITKQLTIKTTCKLRISKETSNIIRNEIVTLHTVLGTLAFNLDSMNMTETRPVDTMINRLLFSLAPLRC